MQKLEWKYDKINSENTTSAKLTTIITLKFNHLVAAVQLFKMFSSSVYAVFIACI